MSWDVSSPESRAAPQLCDRETEYPTSSVHVSPPSPCALQSSVWKHKSYQDTTTEPRLLALGPDSTTTTSTSTISNLGSLGRCLPHTKHLCSTYAKNTCNHSAVRICWENAINLRGLSIWARPGFPFRELNNHHNYNMWLNQ